MSNPAYTRRTPEQWQSIVTDFAASQLSGAAFCKQHHIQYASFCKWRQKLKFSSSHSEPTPLATSFLDLSTLPSMDNGNHWHITLKLGNGVELVLSQA